MFAPAKSSCYGFSNDVFLSSKHNLFIDNMCKMQAASSTANGCDDILI